MKTYLTPNQFANLFFNLYGEQMQRIDAEVVDQIIWQVFQRWEKDVKFVLADSLYGIDHYSGGKAVDLVGPQFHKTWRQTDVINVSMIDSIIWTAVSGSNKFWLSMNIACKALQDQDLAESYIAMYDLDKIT